MKEFKFSRLVYRNSVSGCPPCGYGLKRIQLSKQSKRGKLAASSERTGQKQMPQNTSLITRTHTHTHSASLCSLALPPCFTRFFSFCLMCRATEESKNFSIFAFFLFSSSEQETKHKLFSKNQSSTELYGGFIKIPAY